MPHPDIAESMALYHTAALELGAPTLLLGSHTVMVGEIGGSQVGVSNGINGRTTSPARGLCRSTHGLRNSLRLHGLRKTGIDAGASRVLVHDGEALASVPESDGEPDAPEPEDRADYAQRAVAAIPGLVSATVTVGHRRAGGTAVRRIRPTLNLVPFGAQAADLARTIVERECQHQGVQIAPVRSDAHLHLQVDLNDALAADIAEALTTACAQEPADYENVNTAPEGVRFELHAPAHATAQVLNAIMRPGLLSYPPTVATVTPLGSSATSSDTTSSPSPTTG